MKTYISVGIGDMVYLDAILSPEEKESITEIYWACRFGKVLVPLLDNNLSYPNLKLQHIISDEVGKQAMESLDPIAIPFWHFRPDFPRNFEVGLRLFGILDEWNNGKIQSVDAANMFTDTTRGYHGSSFIKNASSVEHSDYILFHYPTSTRPKGDIASISSDDWNFVNDLAIQEDVKVIVVSDCPIDIPLNCEYIHYINPNIKYFVDLVASCSYFAGCDSFGAHLSTKVLPKERLFIKSHNPNIKQQVLTTTLYRHFCPHPAEDVAEFYKNYIGYP
jgi:hypothetical protein